MKLFARRRRHWAFRSTISRPSNELNELHLKHNVAKRHSYALNHKNPFPTSEVESMRNVARLKMGYYPLPEAEGVKLRSLLSFSQPASVVDPCVGQGTALHLVTGG